MRILLIPLRPLGCFYNMTSSIWDSLINRISFIWRRTYSNEAYSYKHKITSDYKWTYRAVYMTTVLSAMFAIGACAGNHPDVFLPAILATLNGYLGLRCIRSTLKKEECPMFEKVIQEGDEEIRIPIENIRTDYAKELARENSMLTNKIHNLEYRITQLTAKLAERICKKPQAS